MATLFISYRRSDTGSYADRLANRLASFQFEAVFLDREKIGLGENFADSIRQWLSQSRAVLILIGPNWLDARDASGARRLDDPADWVRREIVLSLHLKLPIIPVMFDSPPQLIPAKLPAELVSLATARNYDINGNYFDRDANDLAGRLEKQLVVAAFKAQVGGGALPTTNLLNQLRVIWIALLVVSLLTAAAPLLFPLLPAYFWWFPGAMTIAAFGWWLYWVGESLRPNAARAA